MATLAVAVYVRARTITSSPGLIPRTQRYSYPAAVAEFRHTFLLLPTYYAMSFSNCIVFGYVVIHPSLKVIIPKGSIMSSIIQYKGYVSSVEFTENDNVFFGKVHGKMKSKMSDSKKMTYIRELLYIHLNIDRV